MVLLVLHQSLDVPDCSYGPQVYIVKIIGLGIKVRLGLGQLDILSPHKLLLQTEVQHTSIMAHD